jgi:hypothetical protein
VRAQQYQAIGTYAKVPAAQVLYPVVVGCSKLFAAVVHKYKIIACTVVLTKRQLRHTSHKECTPTIKAAKNNYIVCSS